MFIVTVTCSVIGVKIYHENNLEKLRTLREKYKYLSTLSSKQLEETKLEKSKYELLNSKYEFMQSLIELCKDDIPADELNTLRWYNPAGTSKDRYRILWIFPAGRKLQQGHSYAHKFLRVAGIGAIQQTRQLHGRPGQQA